MKTKFNILLIAFCLILFCFTGNVNAAETISQEKFLNDYLPEKIKAFEDKPYFDYIVYWVDNEETYTCVFIYTNYNAIDTVKPYLVEDDETQPDILYLPKDANGYNVEVHYFGRGANVSESQRWRSSSSRVVKDTDLVLSRAADFIDSSLTIYKDDVPFFPLAPTLTPVTLEQLGEKITGQMGTITIAAIGCLALLIGLPVLLKVFYKFLN